MNIIKIHKTYKGSAMIISLFFFMFITLAIILSVISPAARDFSLASANFNSKKAYFLAESGNEDIFYRLRNNRKISASETLNVGLDSVVTTITDLVTGQKQIISLGDSNSNQRKVSLLSNLGMGASFQYGVQVGAGGFTIGDHSVITGSIYSNGPVVGTNHATVTGSVTVANTPASNPDQQNGSGVPDYNIVFAKDKTTRDIGQSFTVATTGPASKIDLYIKKVGNPSNRTVYLVNDNNGVPDDNYLASGTMPASAVSTSYGWVSVSLTSYPQLVSGNTYWLVVDGGENNSNYYTIGANTGYAGGVAKMGNDHDQGGKKHGSWDNLNPSNADLFFKVYLGGINGLINNVDIGSNGVGDAIAHTVTNSSVVGTIYCQSGTGNNKYCTTLTSDPSPIELPLSEQNIQDWKDYALDTGGSIPGYTPGGKSVSLGPKQINGDLHLDDGDTLTITGTLWITGNFIIDKHAIVKLSSGYGGGSGVIVVDGRISISDDADFQGSGTSGSYILLLSNSNCPSDISCNGNYAISVGKNVDAVMFYASNGVVKLKNHSTAKQITAYGIVIDKDSDLIYSTGLTNVNFVNSPGGTWAIDSWQETQ